MRLCLTIVFLLCCIAWPASADLSDLHAMVECSLPADIMQVQFSEETWVYRLYEDGTVKKIVNKKRYLSKSSAINTGQVE